MIPTDENKTVYHVDYRLDDNFNARARDRYSIVNGVQLITDVLRSMALIIDTIISVTVTSARLCTRDVIARWPRNTIIGCEDKPGAVYRISRR